MSTGPKVRIKPSIKVVDALRDYAQWWVDHSEEASTKWSILAHDFVHQESLAGRFPEWDGLSHLPDRRDAILKLVDRTEAGLKNG